MNDEPEAEMGEDWENDLPPDDGEMDDGPAEADDRSLADGAGQALALALLALLAVGGNHQMTQFWRAQSEPTLAVSITALIVMMLSMLVAVPSLIAAVVFALGSLVTAQRRWGLALLALLVSAAAAAVFLLTE